MVETTSAIAPDLGEAGAAAGESCESFEAARRFAKTS